MSIPDSIVDVVLDMAQGNPGALTAITEMFKADFERSAMAMGVLAAMEIKGPHLWICYKDLCGQDAKELMDRSIKDMGETISHQLQDLPYIHDYKAPERLF